MYIISVMSFTFSIRDFGHPKFLKSQFGHPVVKILAKSLRTSQNQTTNLGESSIKTLTTTLLEIVCKFIFHYKVIFKSMICPDDICQVDRQV